MSASISLMNKDNSIKSILCYNKPEIIHTGILLLKHYDNFKNADAIVNLGAISLLEKHIEPQNDNHSQQFPNKETTVAYHRDGNHALEVSYYINFENFISTVVRRSYNYIYLEENNSWYILTKDNNLITLLEALKIEVQSLQGSHKKSLISFIDKKNDIIMKRNYKQLIVNIDNLTLNKNNKKKL